MQTMIMRTRVNITFVLTLSFCIAILYYCKKILRNGWHYSCSKRGKYGIT